MKLTKGNVVQMKQEVSAHTYEDTYGPRATVKIGERGIVQDGPIPSVWGLDGPVFYKVSFPQGTIALAPKMFRAVRRLTSGPMPREYSAS